MGLRPSSPVSRGLACCGLGGQEGTDLAFLLGVDLGAQLTCFHQRGLLGLAS